MASARQGGIDGDTRRLLSRLASRRKTRMLGRPPERPSHWAPFTVHNPEAAFDEPFNHFSAWTLIADKLEQGEPVEVIEMDQPEGANGYVMKIELEKGAPRLYVKLELTASKVIGRSFHLSDY